MGPRPLGSGRDPCLGFEFICRRRIRDSRVGRNRETQGREAVQRPCPPWDWSARGDRVRPGPAPHPLTRQPLRPPPQGRRLLTETRLPDADAGRLGAAQRYTTRLPYPRPRAGSAPSGAGPGPPYASPPAPPPPLTPKFSHGPRARGRPGAKRRRVGSPRFGVRPACPGGQRPIHVASRRARPARTRTPRDSRARDPGAGAGGLRGPARTRPNPHAAGAKAHPRGTRGPCPSPAARCTGQTNVCDGPGAGERLPRVPAPWGPAPPSARGPRPAQTPRSKPRPHASTLAAKEEAQQGYPSLRYPRPTPTPAGGRRALRRKGSLSGPL